MGTHIHTDVLCAALESFHASVNDAVYDANVAGVPVRYLAQVMQWSVSAVETTILTVGTNRAIDAAKAKHGLK